MDRSSVLGPGGSGSLPRLHFPSIRWCLKCEALCQPFVGLLLTLPSTVVCPILQRTFPLLRPSPFCLRASVRQAEPPTGWLSNTEHYCSTTVSPSLSWPARFLVPRFLHLKICSITEPTSWGLKELMCGNCLEWGLASSEGFRVPPRVS